MQDNTLRTVLARIERTGECWTWPGAWQVKGQPLVRVQGRTWLVHRLAYHALAEPLAPRQQLHKACQGHGCVRPGAGHWELPEPSSRGRRRQLPPGISHEGIDKQGRDIWRLSVYLGRNPDTRKRVEQRERVHGNLQDAIRRREELLTAADAERRRLAAGVRGRTMAELLDRYFPVWQRTPRKGHLPAASTIYGRHWLIETVIKPALGHRQPANLSAGTIAE